MIKIFALMRNILINEKGMVIVGGVISRDIFRMNRNYARISNLGT